MPQAVSTRRQKAASPPPGPLEVTTETKRTVRAASPDALEDAQQSPAEPDKPVFAVRERLAAYGPWEKLQKMTPEDWQHSIGTLYRHKGQQIEDSGVKPPRGAGYLDKFAQPITLDYVKANWGGGYYWWIVNYDSDVLTSLNFRIDAPPKADGAVMLQSGQDKTNELLIGMLEKAQADAKSNLVEPQQAVNKIMEVVSQANKSLWDMFQAQIPKQTDPMEQFKLMLGMLKEAKSITNPEPVAAPVAANPAESAESQLEKSVALLDRLGLLKKANDDGLSGLGKMIGTLKEWGVIPSGSGGGGDKSDWKAVLAEHSPQILAHVDSVVARITTAIIQGRPQGPVQVAAQAVGNVRPGARTVIAARAGGESAGGQEGSSADRKAETAGAPAVAQMTEEELITMAQANVDAFIWIRLAQLVRGGTTGDEVASMLENLAPEMATELRSKTPAEIEMLVGQVPIPDVQSLVQFPRLKPFIQEFLDYWKPEEPAASAGQ